MGDIVLSSAVRSNLLSLQSTADLLGRTQTRLATGKKVNSALDNPTNFFTAANLNARAGDLSNLLDGINSAMKTLEAADTGIKAITRLVESAQASARQALQSTGTTARLTGSVSGLTGASTSVFSGFTDAVDTITINDGTTTGTFTFNTGDDVQDFLDDINNTASLNVKASLTGDGRIQLEATGTNTIVIGGTASAAELLQVGLTAGTTAAGTLNASRTTFAEQYNELLVQIDKLAGDASFNGINLLDGDALTVVFNETLTSKLTISGVMFDAANLGITAAGNDFQTDYDVNVSLGQLTGALLTLRSQASTLGSNLSVVQTRQDFTKSIINTLKTGADNLTLADTNEEGANMLALQTRQQLSTTALSLASQADQAVLRLFG
jgi:flagellin-like hook-associated protein FlgL